MESMEYKLVNDLLRHYKKEIRPIKQSGDITYVFVELSLFDVLELVSSIFNFLRFYFNIKFKFSSHLCQVTKYLIKNTFILLNLIHIVTKLDFKSSVIVFITTFYMFRFMV